MPPPFSVAVLLWTVLWPSLVVKPVTDELQYLELAWG
jgi:hypothetical protein